MRRPACHACFQDPDDCMLSLMLIIKYLNACFVYHVMRIVSLSLYPPPAPPLGHLWGCDRSQLTFLALFDVSAAFDTVDYHILLKRFQFSFCLSCNFLTWLASFLDGRSLCVVHGCSRFQWVPAPHGLPQGSVLAPLLYIIYTSELGPLLTDCALLSQLYADDVQAYLHCLASDAMAAVQAMTLATGALVAWMSSNRLRLNPSK